MMHFHLLDYDDDDDDNQCHLLTLFQTFSVNIELKRTSAIQFYIMIYPIFIYSS